jgi:hypothetical protein
MTRALAPGVSPPAAMGGVTAIVWRFHHMFDPQDTTGLELVPGPDACPCKSSGCRSGWVWRPVAAPAEAQGSAAPAAQGVRGDPEGEPEGGN